MLPFHTFRLRPFAALLAIIPLAVEFAVASPPNILLIVADDLGYADLGCYGSEINETPHINALAATGLRFTDFHSAGPMCTPTRAATLTGKYQQRFGPQFDGALSGKNQREEGLPHGAVTIAEVLKEKGYATACFGKWHLGYQPPFLPPNQGFDEFRGLASGDGDYHTHIDRSGNEDWWHGNEIDMESGYTTDLLTDYSIDFIERCQKEETPFFLYLPHLAIHFPWQGPNDPPHRQKGTDYGNDKWGIIPDPGNVAPHVKAMVEALDASVGRLIDLLERRDLRDNTLVIFTSDNGGYLTYGKNFKHISSNGPFHGQKAQIYEGGHRVPTIVSWPGRIEPAETDTLSHSTDLFPTIAAVAGIETDALALDGADLGPLLFHGDALPDRTLFWRMKSLRAVRRGPWKLCAEGKKVELFRLDTDPGEQIDLSAEEPDQLRELQAAWEAWNRDVNESAKTFAK
ncbi:MAG: sulfatase-like hydrolase/transferase [Verrucomicrobiae bacterium]|nr:sulfatase-like hydrolase/transferase [Verrucomicrobiae bacterium]